MDWSHSKEYEIYYLNVDSNNWRFSTLKNTASLIAVKRANNNGPERHELIENQNKFQGIHYYPILSFCSL